MNYIELAQRAVMEAGASGRNSTVVNASGEWLRFVTWVNQAWLDIQNEHADWLWMRKTKSFQTIANQAEYPVTAAPISLTDFASWVNDSFRIYRTSIQSELFLNQVEYGMFRDMWLYGSLRTSYGQPTNITVSPSKSLILALPPDSTDYTVTGDYQSTPSNLVADTDIPDMPERFHMCIVWKALVHYGGKESYPDAYTRGKEELNRLMTRLAIDQRPSITINRRF